MRVTQATRRRTRAQIVAAATRLFATGGFDATTTREIADRAGIATGTLFNYFPGKEALGLAVLEETARDAAEAFERERRPGTSLEETLFQLIALRLRHLEPFRGWMGALLEAGWSPLRDARSPDEPREPDAFRLDHLRAVRELIAQAGLAPAESPTPDLDLHLYWTLHLGVLSFWCRDDSVNRAASLALLDRSTRLFCQSLRESAGGA